MKLGRFHGSTLVGTTVRAGAITMLIAGTAAAHEGHGAAHGFGAGVAHPFSGTDHVLALVAIGALLALMRLPRGWAIALPVIVAVVHGWAHGVVMTAGTMSLPFIAGFIVASLTLQATGLALGTWLRSRRRRARSLVRRGDFS